MFVLDVNSYHFPLMKVGVLAETSGFSTFVFFIHIGSYSVLLLSRIHWLQIHLQNCFDEMGLLQLAVTWYMLEGKLPTGTSKTTKIQICPDEVA